MKKYILPVIGLALLTGCGKVSDTNVDDKPLNIVSGTVEAALKDIDTSETVLTSSGKKGSGTTTKIAVAKVSGTTTKSNSQSATRAQVVHGTTRAVPVAPRNNNNNNNNHNNHTNTTTAEITQEATNTQSPTFDPKDTNSVSLSFDSKTPNKLGVLREYNDGKLREYQNLSVDTSYIQEELEKDHSKSITDFYYKKDLDGDNCPDLCIYEKEEGMNKLCKYYRCDPDTGVYSPWNELNSLKYEVNINANSGRLEVCRKNDDKIEYENKSYEWNSQKQLVLRDSVHQYTNDEGIVLITYVEYDENGVEIMRRTENSIGQQVDDPGSEPSEE